MSFRLPLNTIANQSLSAVFDGQSYQLEFKVAAGVMVVTIAVNGDIVVAGSRFFANAPLIPYRHLEGEGGNFILTTELDALPDYNEFDVTQFLVYLTAAEVSSARS